MRVTSGFPKNCFLNISAKVRRKLSWIDWVYGVFLIGALEASSNVSSYIFFVNNFFPDVMETPGPPRRVAGRGPEILS